MTSLEDLRRRINELDRQILELVGKRQETSREVARAKRATGQATRDYNREREVLLSARETGKQYGVPPQVAETILRLLIRSSLTTQEQASVAAQGAGSGRSALVIGGAGKMGRWFADFMASQGFSVEVADPAGAPAGSAISTLKPCEVMKSANQRPILPAPPITRALRPEPAPCATTLACSWVVSDERISRRRMFSASCGGTPYCLPASRALSSTSRSRL